MVLRVAFEHSVHIQFLNRFISEFFSKRQILLLVVVEYKSM
jgi:hypothetical protein